MAVFAALHWECVPILAHLRQVRRERLVGLTVWRGVSGHYDVSLVKTGVGTARAGAAARALGDAGRFALFLSTGCAGALAPHLAAGDLVVATAVLGTASGQCFETHAEHRERACRIAERLALPAAVGPLLCSQQVLGTVAAKRTAAAERGAVAVEMEGAPIAARALQAGVPFVAVRAILDTAAAEWCDAQRFVDPRRGALKSLALAAYLTTHPGALPDLLAMRRMMHAAQRSLQRFFGAWLAPAPSTER